MTSCVYYRISGLVLSADSFPRAGPRHPYERYWVLAWRKISIFNISYIPPFIPHQTLLYTPIYSSPNPPIYPHLFLTKPSYIPPSIPHQTLQYTPSVCSCTPYPGSPPNPPIHPHLFVVVRHTLVPHQTLQYTPSICSCTPYPGSSPNPPIYPHLFVVVRHTMVPHHVRPCVSSSPTLPSLGYSPPRSLRLPTLRRRRHLTTTEIEASLVRVQRMYLTIFRPSRWVAILEDHPEVVGRSFTQTPRLGTSW